jgi:hypothetical protein
MWREVQTEADFPVTGGAYQKALKRGVNCFVAKLNTAVSRAEALVYSTYLGGNVSDYPYGIAVDSSGNAYITGGTESTAFPVTTAAYQGTQHAGSCDYFTPDCYNAFVTKLNASGGNLVYSTYLGGTTNDIAQAIALDSAGDAYITGFAQSSDFPTLNALQSTLGGTQDAFVTELNPTGSAPVYSTYLGGSGLDQGNGIAVDGSGNAYVAGFTESSDFPTRFPYQAASALPAVFVSKLCDGVQGPGILEIGPNHGGNGGSATVTIVGSDFHAGATVMLSCAGQPDILGSNVTVTASGSVITATFNLVGATPEACSIVVTNPDGTSFSDSQAFTVEQGGAPNVWVDIVGWNTLRAGEAQPYFIIVGNRGNVDASHVAVSVAVPRPLTADDSGVPLLVDRYTSATDGDVISFAVPTVAAGIAQAVALPLSVPDDRSLAHHKFTLRVEQQSVPAEPPGSASVAVRSSAASSGGLRGLLYGPLLYDGCGKPVYVQCPACDPQWNNVQVADSITLNESLNSQRATLNFLEKSFEVAADIVATGFVTIFASGALGDFVAEAITEKVTLGAEINLVTSSVVNETFDWYKKASTGDLNDPVHGYDDAVREARDYGQAIAIFKLKILRIDGVVKSKKLLDLGNKGLAAMNAAADAIDTLRDAWPTLETLLNQLNNAREKYTYDNNVYLCGEVKMYLACLNSHCSGGRTTPPGRSGTAATLTTEVVTSGDPNDKAGPQGVGTQQYISGRSLQQRAHRHSPGSEGGRHGPTEHGR